MSSPSSLVITLATIQQQTAPYIYSIEFVFSIVNCSLNILLLSRRQFRTSTCCRYFLAASVAMLFNLVFGLGTNLYMISNGNLSLTSSAFCKLRSYLIHASAMIYRWYLVAACLDRYALSSNSVRLRNFVRMNVARRVVVFNAVVWPVLSVHILIFHNIKEGKCGALYSTVTQYYHNIFILLAGFFLPALVMIISALLTYRNLVDKRKRRQVMIIRQRDVNNEIEDVQRKRDLQVLITMISQVVVFIITMIPWTTYFSFISATISINNKSNELLAIERFFYFVVEPIVYLFPISSLYLYIMSSNMFRNELLVMLQTVWRRFRCFNNMHRIQPIQTNVVPTMSVKYTAKRKNPLQSLNQNEKY